MRFFLSFFLLFSFLQNDSFAQKIFVDDFIEMGDLKLFRSVDNKNNFYYLPDQVRIAKKEGQPQFLFMRYIKGDKGSVISGGGGIIHAVVALDVTESQKRTAQKLLQRTEPDAKIIGPISYEEGMINLVSAVAAPNGGFVKKIIGTGKAPVMEGHQAAIAMHLDKDGANLLWRTFELPTPDLSFSFEMRFAGYHLPIKGRVSGDFDQIYKSKEKSLGASGNINGVVLGADIGKMMEELKQIGAIEIYTEGDDAALNNLTEIAFQKLTDIMFEQVSPQEMEAGSYQKKLTSHSASTAPKGKGGNDSTFPFSLTASYKSRKVKQSGKFSFNFDKVTTGTQFIRFDENIGQLKRRCRTCFKTVNLIDEAYEKREIIAALDAKLKDFDNFINNVQVKIEKKHNNSTTTYVEDYIDATNQSEKQNRLALSYEWRGEEDYNRDDWLKYNYQVIWNFHGGVTIDEGWKNSDKDGQELITLSPPLKSRKIYFEADPDVLKESEKKVRAIEVTVYFNYGGNEESTTFLLRPNKNLSEEVMIILPKGSDEFQYEYTWIYGGHPDDDVKSKKIRTRNLLNFVHVNPGGF